MRRHIKLAHTYVLRHVPTLQSKASLIHLIFLQAEHFLNLGFEENGQAGPSWQDVFDNSDKSRSISVPSRNARQVVSWMSYTNRRQDQVPPKKSVGTVGTRSQKMDSWRLHVYRAAVVFFGTDVGFYSTEGLTSFLKSCENWNGSLSCSIHLCINCFHFKLSTDRYNNTPESHLSFCLYSG